MTMILLTIETILDILESCVIELPSALDALCYDTTPAPDDDPRSWTGVA